MKPPCEHCVATWPLFCAVGFHLQETFTFRLLTTEAAVVLAPGET